MNNYHLFDPEVDYDRLQFSKVPNKSTTTKARASLPDILELRNIQGKTSVFTKRPLPRVTQFGPLEAPLVTKQEVEDTNFLIKLDIEKCQRHEIVDASYIYYDTADENVCNWLMFVQPAKFFAEQNLCACQVQDYIYFITTRDVSVGEELKVWYSPTYAKFMSASVLTPTSGVVSVPQVSNGKRRTRKAKPSRRMQIYPNSMLRERDVRSVPPKKRGWKRAKDKRSESTIGNMISAPRFEAQLGDFDMPTVTVKRFICAICQKAFKTNSKLKIHSVIHSSQRNFLCHLCGATFKRKDKLREHESKVHDKFSKQRRKLTDNFNDCPFKCHECHIGFLRRGMFLNHIIRRHPGKQTSSIEELARPLYKSVRDFLCPYCDKTYKSSTKRKLHILKQHPGRQLPASIKLKDSFPLQNNHTVMKETVATSPFHCQHCERQYSTKHKRDKHMREKHSEMVKNACIPQQECGASIPQMCSMEQATFSTMPQQGMVNTLSENTNSVHSHAAEANMYQMTHMPNVSHPVQPEVFCLQNTGPQTLIELSATDRDLLNQAMSDLEPAATSTQPAPHYAAYQSTPPKDSRYSRYPLGRKRMLLKSYEASQNQLLAQNIPPAQPHAQPEKQLPYKARLLSNEWRSVNWQEENIAHCETSAITEIQQQSHSNDHAYPPVLHHQQTLASMLGSTANDGTMLLNDGRASGSDGTVLPEHDVSDLVNAYNNADSAPWMFQSTYDNLNDPYATR